MRRLFIIPFVIWFGGCSLFLYDSASFGIAGVTDKSGIAANVTVSSNGWFANSHYTVTLTNKDGWSIWYTYEGVDPTNNLHAYSIPLQFSNTAPFPLLARTMMSTGSNEVWGSLSSNWIPVANGSGPHPWHIASRTHLSNIRHHLSNHYLQVADIDMTEGMAGAWIPVGVNQASAFTGSFTGGLPGKVYAISDFSITNTLNGVGLFGWCQGAGLTNIRIVNATVSVNLNFAGILCGSAKDTFINDCHVTGTVFDPAPGQQFVGGLAGALENCTVINCSAAPSSSGQIVGANHVGGLVGMLSNGSLMNSWTSFGVTGAYNVGGLCGLVAGAATLQGCTFDGGDITGTDNIGGLVGRMSGDALGKPLINGGIVTAAAATVSGTNNVGGLVGNVFMTRGITASRADMHVRGLQNVGGLIGLNVLGSVSNCQAWGSVAGLNAVGGLIGDNNAGVTNCMYGSEDDSVYQGGPVIGGGNVGGLVGYNIGNIYRSGVVLGGGNEIAGNTNVGGFVGAMDSPGMIVSSFAQCPVVCSNEYGGGFVGTIDIGSFSNCYATGGVSGAGSWRGGFAGRLNDPTASLYYCYSTGLQLPGSGVGAFAGFVSAGVGYTSCYYLTNEMVGYATNAAGTGTVNNVGARFSDAMKQGSTYAGWDIGSSFVWNIDEGTSYPYFNWQGTQYIPR